MTGLNLLSGGAAQGLVKSLAPAFKARTGFDIEGEFGAVGAMAEKLLAGRPTDLLILTEALITTLAKEQLVMPATIRNVGAVETALAVRAGDPIAQPTDTAALCMVFLAADAIYVPDIQSSTAGIHVAKVLGSLGIRGETESRLKIYPNGATAMRHLAESRAERPVGCTQSTEIIATPGVTLSGALPPGYDLATTYTAAISADAVRADEAQLLIDLLTGAEHRELRRHAGFI